MALTHPPELRKDKLKRALTNSNTLIIADSYLQATNRNEANSWYESQLAHYKQDFEFLVEIYQDQFLFTPDAALKVKFFKCIRRFCDDYYAGLLDESETSN